MHLGRISYTNTDPFFFGMSEQPLPFRFGVPRELSRLARAGDIVAAPLPLVDCWDLEDKFIPLGPWGIAARGACRSVLLVSRAPMADLNGVTIGLTTESSTSVQLCETLIRARHGHNVRMKRGFDQNDDARLLIGDEALRVWAAPEKSGWPVMTDLAAEWWDWKKLPFVFARWVVSREISLEARAALAARLESSLANGLQNLAAIARSRSADLGLSENKIVEYLAGITYTLGPDELDAARAFRDLAATGALS